MKRIVILSGYFLLLFMTSCTKGYQEMNENPNGVKVAAPERLLNPALYATVYANIVRSYSINNELMQVTVPLGESTDIHRYIIRSSVSDFVWNDWFLEKTNFQDMYNITAPNRTLTTGQAKPYMAIATILDVWTTSLLTDTFGDIPYFQSNKGNIDYEFTPAFDKQEDIYKDLFKRLEEANTLLTGLSTAQLLTANQKGLDALYGNAASNVIELDRWRKFGNSLYLRLLMRASAKTEPVANGKTPVEKIAEIVANPTQYPVFVNNAESAVLKLTGDQYPLRSPFASYRDGDFNPGGSVGEFFVNTLSEAGDPRLPLWITKVDNAYKGIQSGYSASGAPPVRGSTLVPALRLDSLLGTMLTYAEVQFTLAEAALKGYIPGDPKTYYNQGVQAGIEYWKVAMPVNYLTTSEVAWQENATDDQKLEQIMTQKYYALFFTDFQQWFEYRRTQRPTLPIGPGVANGGEMPSRLYYPVAVQSLNRTHYNEAVSHMGADDLKTKVWWQKK